MVERYRRGKGKQELLGNHQKCWIWGKNAVGETLRAGRWHIHELRLSDTLPSDVIQTSRETAADLDVPVIVETPDELTNRCRSGEHQGFLAKMAPFPYEQVEDVLADASESPLYVVLDSIQDPYNFGAILRSADVMAADAVFIGETGQVGVTSLVARTSVGAVNHIRIVQADNLAGVVAKLQGNGVRIVAATGGAAIACVDYDWTQATALIIGNEGTGVNEALLELSDERVSIPQFGHVESLNAAVAAGILLYEARRQRTVSG
jgi:23S rRNA (guanosine2251-2'-O)-methyltransferase